MRAYNRCTEKPHMMTLQLSFSLCAHRTVILYKSCYSLNGSVFWTGNLQALHSFSLQSFHNLLCSSPGTEGEMPPYLYLLLLPQVLSLQGHFFAPSSVTYLSPSWHGDHFFLWKASHPLGRFDPNLTHNHFQSYGAPSSTETLQSFREALCDYMLLTSP